MPFKSEAQRRFMYAKHPEIAKEFEEKTPQHEVLPEHVKRKVKRRALKKISQSY
jgi:hypothetical protein